MPPSSTTAPTPPAAPTTGTAICPYCASRQELVMKGEHVVTGRLIRSHTELLRFRDESGDKQVDFTTGKLAADLDEDEVNEAVLRSVPATRTVQVDGLEVRLPAGLRPAFTHICPVIGHSVTLYGDTEGGSVQ